MYTPRMNQQPIPQVFNHSWLFVGFLLSCLISFDVMSCLFFSRQVLFFSLRRSSESFRESLLRVFFVEDSTATCLSFRCICQSQSVKEEESSWFLSGQVLSRLGDAVSQSVKAVDRYRERRARLFLSVCLTPERCRKMSASVIPSFTLWLTWTDGWMGDGWMDWLTVRRERRRRGDGSLFSSMEHARKTVFSSLSFPWQESWVMEMKYSRQMTDEGREKDRPSHCIISMRKEGKNITESEWMKLTDKRDEMRGKIYFVINIFLSSLIEKLKVCVCL